MLSSGAVGDETFVPSTRSKPADCELADRDEFKAAVSHVYGGVVRFGYMCGSVETARELPAQSGNALILLCERSGGMDARRHIRAPLSLMS
jgi:hypothetical protein